VTSPHPGELTAQLERPALARWTRYFIERSPLPVLLIVGAGQSLSAFYLFRTGFDLRPLALSAVGIIGLLLVMRMMDELKDFEKDKVAHPDRPLPRGLVSKQEVRRVLLSTALLLLAYAGGIAVAGRALAGALYAFTVGYTFLMFREFFVPRLLNRNQFVYAVSHQAVVLPMYLFAVAVSSPASTFATRSLWFALTGLGGSFVYEVSRKLDPNALPILGTYLRLHGRTAVTFALLAALALLAIGAWKIDVHPIVWPAVALMLAVIPIIYLRPLRFRIVEGTAALVMIVQMLALALQHAWRMLA
jgi:4-hydroxybenzoate polyprenyltransferase